MLVKLLKPLFAIFFLLPQAWGDSPNQAIFFGGGCDEIDDKKKEEHLYGRFFSTQSILKERQWSIDPVYGKKSSVEGLLQAFDKALEKAEKGELQQLFFGILTHGLPAQGKEAQVLCASKTENSVDLLAINDPKLLSRLEKLKKLGVKIAVANGSCYSGSSVTELSPYACTLGSTSGARLSWGDSFFESFGRLHKKNAPFSAETVWQDTMLNDSTVRMGYIMQPSISGLMRDYGIEDQITAFLLSGKVAVGSLSGKTFVDYDLCFDPFAYKEEAVLALTQHVQNVLEDERRKEWESFAKKHDLPESLKDFDQMKVQLTELLRQAREKQKEIPGLEKRIAQIDKELQEQHFSLDFQSIANWSEQEQHDAQIVLQTFFGITAGKEKNSAAEIALLLRSKENLQNNPEKIWAMGNKSGSAIFPVVDALLAQIPSEILATIDQKQKERQKIEDLLQGAIDRVDLPAFDPKTQKPTATTSLKFALNRRMQLLRLFEYEQGKKQGTIKNDCENFHF